MDVLCDLHPQMMRMNDGNSNEDGGAQCSRNTSTSWATASDRTTTGRTATYGFIATCFSTHDRILGPAISKKA